MTTPLQDWELPFARIALLVAGTSTCARRKVGAVLINRYRRVLSVGANIEKPHSYRCDMGECPRGQKTTEEQPAYAPYNDCIAMHAEERALSHFIGINLSGARLYVTEVPCSTCRTYIADKFPNVAVVVVPKGE